MPKPCNAHALAATRRLLVAGGSFWALVLLVASPAFADTPSLPPVLGPDAPALLEAALKKGGIELRDGQVQSHHATLTLCDAGGAKKGRCTPCTLRHPNAPCAGEKTPAFCVEAGEHSGRLATALADPSLAAIWHSVGDAAPEQATDREAREADALAPWLGVLSVLGLLTWLALHWLGGARPRAGASLSLMVVVGAAATGWQLWQTGLGLWDALLAPLSAIVAGLLVARLRDDTPSRRGARGKLALAGAGAALGLVAGELVAGAMGTQLRAGALPPLLLPAERARWQLAVGRDPRWDQLACQHLFGASPIGATPAGAAATWHLGDSMVYGLGVAAPERFVGLLAARDGRTHHNLGVPGTSIGLAANLARRARDASPRPALVVLHAFAGNDLEELDAPLGRCCGAQALTNTAGEPTCTERIAGPRGEVGTVLTLLRAARPPWLLSWPARHSHLAAATEQAWLHMRGSAALSGGDDDADEARRSDDDAAARERAKQRYQTVLRTLVAAHRRAGVPLAIVVHPRRADVLAAVGRRQAPPRDASAEFEALIAAAAPDTPRFSPRDALTAAARQNRDGEQHLFLAQGYDDPHYTAEGHRVVADALAPVLGSWIREAVSRPTGSRGSPAR